MSYVIREGSKGLAVKKLQMYLNVISGSSLKEDGNFGPEMKEAVMAFQKDNGLNPDGVIGSLTWDRIIFRYKNGTDPDQPQPPLKYGDAGLDVAKMQLYLNMIMPGSAPISDDGVYGAQTEARVMLFQNTYGLPGTGMIDEKTWDKIIDLLVL